MRVLVNALPVRRGGTPQYVMEQLAALDRVAPSIDLHTLVSPWAEIDGLPGTTEVVPVRNVPTRFAYEQLRLPFRTADVLYCPADFAPLWSHAPIVLTVQNPHYFQTAFELPETKPSRPWHKVKANHWALRRCDAIVAISGALADDISRTLPGLEKKTRVIHSGAARWPEHSEPTTGLPHDFVVSVTSAQPHKRVGDLVTAWARARSHQSGRSVGLVLVGTFSDDTRATHRTLAGRFAPDLVHTGQIRERARLKWIYENARCMVLTTCLETFSFTPAEAGAVGCPLIITDIPVHREIVGDHARYVLPRDVVALTSELITEFRRPPGRRNEWHWTATWDDNARKLAQVFKEVSSANHPSR